MEDIKYARVAVAVALRSARLDQTSTWGDHCPFGTECRRLLLLECSVESGPPVETLLIKACGALTPAGVLRPTAVVPLLRRRLEANPP